MTMQTGFIFNQDLCVACNACRAACILENGWSSSPREIYTLNPGALPGLPVVHMSLACNHCEKPVCLEGCPAGAYSRDPVHGAIIYDEDKCIGCNYCIWNCPYDAPKPLPEKGLIEKCNLCIDRLHEQLTPACSAGCPTGALSFGSHPGFSEVTRPEWFPDMKINPSLYLAGNSNIKIPEVVPEKLFGTGIKAVKDPEKSITNEWSLIIFSLLVTLSLAVLFSSVLKGIFPDRILLFSLIICSGIVSFFHLGRPFRSWRSVINIKRSPLSREISLYLLFSLLALAGLLFNIPEFIIASVATGLLLLVVIDSVYLYAENSRRLMLHSGQTFLTGLLLTSLFAGMIVPLVFIAVIKTFSSVYYISTERRDSICFRIRFFRIALLIIALTAIISGISTLNYAVYAMFIAGELLDRITYYYDFNPVSISNLIKKFSNIS